MCLYNERRSCFTITYFFLKKKENIKTSFLIERQTSTVKMLTLYQILNILTVVFNLGGCPAFLLSVKNRKYMDSVLTFSVIVTSMIYYLTSDRRSVINIDHILCIILLARAIALFYHLKFVPTKGEIVVGVVMLSWSIYFEINVSSIDEVMYRHFAYSFTHVTWHMLVYNIFKRTITQVSRY
jgi:hypothetical protein